jgi:hypothetical protein
MAVTPSRPHSVITLKTIVSSFRCASETSYHIRELHQTSGSQPLWYRGPVNSFIIGWEPGIIDARARYWAAAHRFRNTALNHRSCRKIQCLFTYSRLHDGWTDIIEKIWTWKYFQNLQLVWKK